MTHHKVPHLEGVEFINRELFTDPTTVNSDNSSFGKEFSNTCSKIHLDSELNRSYLQILFTLKTRYVINL